MSFLVLLHQGDMSRAALWVDRRTGETGTDTPLVALAERVHADPKGSLCVALPGEGVMSRMLRLPMKRKRDLSRAAHIALDDAQAAPMEDRLIALGTDQNGARMVSALPRSLVEEGLDAARDAGLDPDIVIADHTLLPMPDEGAAFTFRIGDRVMVCTEHGAFTAEAAFADEMLSIAEASAHQELTRDALIDPAAAPNFRQGALAKRRPLPDLKPFALAASLLVAAGVVFLIGTMTEGLRYAGAAKALRTEAEASFLRAYPGTPVVDIERQLRSRGARTVVRSDFLPLTAILADVLSEEERTRITSLSYDADGQLTAELTFASFPDLERVTEALSERGIIAEEGSDARSDGDGDFVTQLFLRAV